MVMQRSPKPIEKVVAERYPKAKPAPDSTSNTRPPKQKPVNKAASVVMVRKVLVQ